MCSKSWSKKCWRQSLHKLEYQITADGSSTLYAPIFGESYHSRHGAIQESMHVFIAMGLQEAPSADRSLSVLEMGFGTGLNALLTLLHKKEREIRYTGIEAFPLSLEMTQSLNYPKKISGERVGELYESLHQSPWEKWTEIDPGFLLKKCHSTLESFQPEEKFDLIYFDAFAPEAQPELWTPEIFERLYALSNPDAVFVTYSAKGDVRRGLMAAGFEMERIPGPPGKRQMLRGRVVNSTE